MILPVLVSATFLAAALSEPLNSTLGVNRFTSTTFDGEGCPGTSAQQYTAIQAKVTVNAPCNRVIDEIKARIKGTQTGAWIDPHNKGVYREVTHPDQHPETEIYVDHLTGNRKYVDSVKFTFLETTGRSKCDIAACSMSQVESANDASTNFCNIYNLYCSKDQGCTTIGMPFTLGKQVIIRRNGGSGASKSRCKSSGSDLRIAPEVPLTKNAFTGEGCPGTAAQTYTASKVEVTANASCTHVGAEIVARVKANVAGKWMDPHNNGTYSIWEEPEGSHVETQHHTGNLLYYDLQKFTLTDISANQCKINACSMSQGTSNNDASTNYCNMRNLYCGPKDSCTPVKHSFDCDETNFIPRNGGSGHDVKKCDTRTRLSID